MNILWVAILVFGAVFLAVFAANSLLLDLFQTDDRKRTGERLKREFRHKQRDQAQQLVKNFSQIAYEAMEANPDKQGVLDRFRILVEQSGLDISPDRLLAIAGALGLALGAVCWLLMGTLLGVVGAIIGIGAPLLYVQMTRARRLAKLTSQVPDAFDLMSRVIRAGQTIPQAMMSVADEFDKPIAEEFGFCYEQQNLGLDAEAALRELSRRTGLLEIKIFVLALLVQRQTGGNLAELLDKLATIVRDRFRLRGMINTLTAEGKIQAIVLLALPLFLYLAMLFFNPSYALLLFQHPMLPIVGVSMEVLGWLWIRKIINFDV